MRRRCETGSVRRLRRGGKFSPRFAPRRIDFDAACSRRNFGVPGRSTRLISGGDRSMVRNGRPRSCARATAFDGLAEVMRTWSAITLEDAFLRHELFRNGPPRVLRRRRGLFRTWWGSARPSGAPGRPGHGRAPFWRCTAARTFGRPDRPARPRRKTVSEVGEVAGLELGRRTGPHTTLRARGFPSSLR
jgi:hypothetical protein